MLCPPKSYVERLNLSGMVLGSRALRTCFGWGEVMRVAPVVGRVALQEEDGISLSYCEQGKTTEDLAGRLLSTGQGGGSHQDPNCCLDLDVQPPGP